jgi:hypothetical protein
MIGQTKESELTRAVIKLAEALQSLSDIGESRSGLKICCLTRGDHKPRCPIGSALADPTVQRVLLERKGS